MLSELKEHFNAINSKKNIKVLILKANGPVFSSGHDLKEIRFFI